MKRPYLDQLDRWIIRTKPKSFSAARLNLHLAWMGFKKEFGKVFCWFIYRGNPNVFVYLYYLLWFAKLAVIVAAIVYILTLK